MTRVVVQRTLNTSTASQNRQSSSAPSSANVSVPSSANSSTSSHPPANVSSLNANTGVPCQEDAVQSGREAELASLCAEDNANFGNELNKKLAASASDFEGGENERYQAYLEGEPADDFARASCNTTEENLDWREGERVPQLAVSSSAGEFLEAVVYPGEEELGKGKEVADEGRFETVQEEGERYGGCPSDDAAVVMSRAAEDSFNERGQEEETSVSRHVQIRSQSASASKSFVLPSLQAPGTPNPPPFPGSFYSSDAAPIHEAHHGRFGISHGSTEPVGCSYLSASVPTPPLSVSSSRRGSWLGSSGSSAPPRGGFSRRGVRGGRPSRNSPNSSRPSSPRSYGEGDGYNSADEQNSRSSASTAYENNEERERQFEVEIRCAKNYEVRRMAADGNCLFRAVADQVYGDAEMYDETRQMCIDYMEKERDHFSQFVTESFTAYCKRKRRDKVYGNNLEIQAMAEMYNRPIHIYSYSPEPINIFHGNYETDLPPIRLSYHRGNHYNSLIDPRRPAVGAGLGFGSLRGTNVDRDQVKAALKAQQDQQIDKALLAEGRFYSDIELTEQEIQRMVMEASRAEFFEEEKHRHYAPWSEETSTSAAAAEPSSSGTTGSPKSAVQTVSLPATSTAAADSSGLTPNLRMLMSMGFSYLQVMEACSIFGDDVNNMLCYLLETENSSSGEGESSMYRKKGKAAER